jgi:hypothetical protein
MKKMAFLFIYSFLQANTIEINELENKKSSDIIYYSDNIESKLNTSINKEAKTIVKQLDVLISKMHSFQEKEYILKFKSLFVEKYFYPNKPIADINRNINKILNDRSNKKLITYEREINNNRNLLK